MDKPLISILLAAYNVSQFIDRCLDTLINQTYKNIEIIVVNDGSSDDTGHICDLYALQYTKIKVFHTLNNGVSVARNHGIENASGDYITFVDPDDVVSLDMIERMYNYLVDKKCDIVICGSYYCFSEKGRKSTLHVPTSQVFGRDEVMQKLFDDSLGSQTWGKLYKRSQWANIRFIPGRVYAEDVAILHLVFDKAQRIGYLAEPLYYYYINENTLTTSYRPFKWMSTYLAFKERLEFAEQKYPTMTKTLIGITINFARLTLDNFLQKKDDCDKPYISEIEERLKKSRMLVWNLSSMKFHNKIIISFYCLSPWLYSQTIGMIHRVFYFFKPNKFR